MAIKLKVELPDLSHESLKHLYSRIKALPDGSYNIFLTDKKLIRSKKQNAYYWGVLLQVLKEHTGSDVEELHEILKKEHNLRTFYKPGGGLIEYGGSTKMLNTKEFTDYIDKCRQWAINELGVQIPAPNELPEDVYIEFFNSQL